MNTSVKNAYEELKTIYKRGDLDSPDSQKKFIDFKKKVRDTDLSPEDKLYWSSHVLIYEIEDYLGTEQHFSDWEREFRVFANNPDKMGLAKTPEEIAILKSKVRCAIAGIHIIYQKHEYNQALDESKKLERFIRKHLHNDELKRYSYGLLGMLKYVQGKIFRQQALYDDAVKCFNEAILAYHERAIFKSNNSSDSDEVKKSEQSFSLVRIAWCVGFGLGFTYFTRGDISNAQFSVVSALSIMLRHGYDIYQNNLKLLKVGIRRAAIASYKDSSNTHKHELIQLEGEVNKSLETFDLKNISRKKNKYNKYQNRALFELSLIRYYLSVASDDEKEIEQYKLIPTLDELINSAGEDPYWKAQALIIKGHFCCHQKKFKKARALADDDAVLTLDKIAPVRVSALLLKGKAYFGDGKYDDAEEQYTKAYKESATNPRFRIIALLRLVDCALKKNKYSRALKIWEQIPPDLKKIGLQYAYAKKAFANTQREIMELESKIIIFNANEVFAYEKAAKPALTKLKKWLRRHAELRAGGTTIKAANLLGIDEATFKTW